MTKKGKAPTGRRGKGRTARPEIPNPLPCDCSQRFKRRTCAMHGPAILAKDPPWSDPENQAKVERLLAGARQRTHRWLPIVVRCTGCGRLTVSRLRTDRWRVRQWPTAVTWAEVDAQAEQELTVRFGPCAL